MASLVEFILLSIAMSIGHVNAGEGQRTLLSKLFENYQILERPVANDSARVLIKMQFYLRQVMDINEKQQILRSSIWLNLVWTDDRLLWDPKSYRNVSKIIVPYSKIWAPDILLWNSANQDFDAMFKTNVEIQNDGLISWVPPSLFTSTCSIDITWFPFDLQACTLKFSSWTYEYRRVDLEPIEEKVDTSNYQRNGEWDLEDAFCQRNLVTYECCPNDAWVDITVTIKLRRRVLYYMFNIIIPSVIISCIGLLTFALPCESGEKVTMSVTILLSLAFFMTMVAETLPSTSEAIPFLGIYFGSLMLLCAISLVVTVFVGSIHHRKPEISPVPNWIHKWFSCRFAVFFRMLPPDHPLITANEAFPFGDLEKPASDVKSLRYRGKEDGHSRSQNKESMIHQNGHTYKGDGNKNTMKSVTVVSSMDDRSPIIMPAKWGHNHTSVPQVVENLDKQITLAKDSVSPPKQNGSTVKLHSGKMVDMAWFVEDATEVVECLKEITTYITETERLESIKREWRLAAAVIDRIFMYISIALFIVFNFLMAILAPNTPMSVVNIY